MKIKLKLTQAQIKAIALSSLDADVEEMYDGFKDKYRKVMITEAHLLIRRLLLGLINSTEGKKKTWSLSPLEALMLERILREALNNKKEAIDDYTHNILLVVANELDEQLINL